MRARAAFSVVCLLALAGCGLRYVELDRRGVTQINATNAPVTTQPDGSSSVRFQPTLRGATTSLPYDGILWRFARLPAVRAADGNLALLDTGMGDVARATLDVVKDGRHPAHLGDDIQFAHLKTLAIGSAVATDVPVVVETHQWQVRALGLPLYRTRGWVLGMPLLEQAKYVAFDNGRRRATIGFEPFDPATRSQELEWASYEMTIIDGRPHVRLPVAGRTIEMLADSAGGPRLILRRADWDEIAGGVRVTRHRVEQYPTWGGHQSVDAYRVRRLPFGPLTLRNETVWVLRGDPANVVSAFGLGLFDDERAVAVWDFAAGRFWIGRRRAA
jgi:hypothetical protein